MQKDATALNEKTDSIDEKSDAIISNQSELDAKADAIVSTTEQIASSTEDISANDRSDCCFDGPAKGNQRKNCRFGFEYRRIQSENRPIDREHSSWIPTLAQSGGIIANAKLPQEIYHNARLFEQRGDYANARKNYVRFFDFKLQLVDPHLRFQSFLKLQEGIEGAREVYRTLSAKNGDDVTILASMLLSPNETRIERLTKYSTQHPEFAPVFYFLSQEFSSSRLGTQDVGDMADEKRNL